MTPNSHGQSKARRNGLAIIGIWFVVMFAGVMILQTRWRNEVQVNAGLRQQLAQLQKDRDRNKSARDAYVAVLRHFPVESDFIVARATDLNMPIFERKPGTSLVYFIDPGCAACRLNYDSLSAIEQRYPGSVKIVTLNDDSLRLQDYAKSEHLPTRIWQITGGQLRQIVPMYGWPLTFLFDHDSLLSIVDGKLKEQDFEQIRHVLAAR